MVGRCTGGELDGLLGVHPAAVWSLEEIDSALVCAVRANTVVVRGAGGDLASIGRDVNREAELVAGQSIAGGQFGAVQVGGSLLSGALVDVEAAR